MQKNPFSIYSTWCSRRTGRHDSSLRRARLRLREQRQGWPHPAAVDPALLEGMDAVDSEPGSAPWHGTLTGGAAHGLLTLRLSLTDLFQAGMRFHDDPSGGYWRGGVWLPLAHMAAKALERSGYAVLARNLLEHQTSV